jgi:hypothetical protein
MGIKRENASEHERDVRVVGGTQGHGRSTRKRAERRSEREKGRKGEREKGRKGERTKGRKDERTTGAARTSSALRFK